MQVRFLRLCPVLALSILVSACAVTPPPGASAPPAAAVSQGGLDRVMGKNAAALLQFFGKPDLDVREGPARKLQFASEICVLDAYLYPPAAAKEPIVRYLDARLPNGEDFDRASCIAALSRRAQAR